jgi:putative transposase
MFDRASGHTLPPSAKTMRWRHFPSAEWATMFMFFSLSLVRAVTLIKSNSSKWMKETQRTFAWQKGYGAFSVSSSNVSAVIRYIDQQEAHHKKKSFDDEFIALLKKHGVEFDPRYVLD